MRRSNSLCAYRPACWPRHARRPNPKAWLSPAHHRLRLREKVSAMRTEEYFEERARRADPTRVQSDSRSRGQGESAPRGR